MNLLQQMKRFAELQVRERTGSRNHPAILWAHELCKMGEGVADEIAWCSSILNLSAALINLPRSGSAAARSWIDSSLGELTTDPALIHMLLLGSVKPGNNVLVFRRGKGAGQLGADVKKAPGHVALFEATMFLDHDAPSLNDKVIVFGGNQSNKISSASFLFSDVIALLQVRTTS